MKDRLEHAKWEADRAAEMLSAAAVRPVGVRGDGLPRSQSEPGGLFSGDGVERADLLVELSRAARTMIRDSYSSRGSRRPARSR
jgi:hypothetical protein